MSRPTSSEAFLATIRKEWGPSDDMKKSVRASVAATIASGAGGVDEPPCRPTARPSGRLLRAIGSGTFMLGLVVAGVLWSRGPRPETRAVVSPPPPVVVVVQPEPPKATEVPAVSLDSLPDAPPPPAVRAAGSPSPSTPAASESTLAAELLQLRAAQQSLRAGAPRDALAALAVHATRFPRGVLREERMALQALAFCDLGDVAAARAARAELERTAPASPHLDRLSTSCAAP